MNKSKFMELRDIAQGDFAIKEGKLFYKENLISTNGRPILVSSEEVFFVFKTQDKALATEFSEVIFRNFEWPTFFKCSTDLLFGSTFLQFVDEKQQQHSFRLVSHNGSGSTKIVGSNFVKRIY